MDAKDALALLLEGIGKESGVTLALDSDGVCMIENEDGTECEIRAIPESADFLLTSLVGDLRETDGVEFLAGVMALNSEVGQGAGATIGLDEPSRLLMLHQRHSARGLEAEELERRIEQFYDLTEELGATLLARDFSAREVGADAEPAVAEAAAPQAESQPQHWRRI
jgi:Tir chaperone protein (CesT) family